VKPTAPLDGAAHRRAVDSDSLSADTAPPERHVRLRAILESATDSNEEIVCP
jgi:hypothetical protein